MKTLSNTFLLTDQLLKRTTSRCPVCHASCPAEVWRTGSIPAKVMLKRTCPEHGEASVCIASDARFYWLAKGKPENACCSRPTACATEPNPSPSQEGSLIPDAPTHGVPLLGGVRGGLAFDLGQRGHEDVFPDGALREQEVGLEDEADLLVADGGELQFIELAEVFASKFNAPARGAVERADDLQQSAFAGAAAPDDN